MGYVRATWLVIRGVWKICRDFFVRWFLPLHDDSFNDESSDEDNDASVRPFGKDDQ